MLRSWYYLPRIVQILLFITGIIIATTQDFFREQYILSLIIVPVFLSLLFVVFFYIYMLPYQNYRRRTHQYAQQENLESAKETADKAIILYPKNASSYNLRAGVHEKLKCYNESINDASTALRLATNTRQRFESHHLLGTAYYAQRNYQLAFEAWDKASSEASKINNVNFKINAYHNRAVGLYWTNRLPEALEDINKAIALNQQNSAVQAMLGWIQLRLKDYVSALEAFNISYGISQHPLFLLGAVLASFKMGNYNQATQLWQQLVTNDERYKDNKWVLKENQLHREVEEIFREFLSETKA